MSLLLLLAAVNATVSHNDACHFTDTSACFVDWPRQETSPQVKNIMALTLGWYIHGIIKSMVPGIGLRSGALQKPCTKGFWEFVSISNGEDATED